VNPNGIPISPVSSSPLQGEGTTVLRVGTAGRMTAAKGPQVFFNIAKELTERRQDVRFVWIGGEKNEASGEIVNRDVVNRGSRMTSGVEVTGWLAPEETLKKMAELDIFLMTSEWEGLPYALLEAMSLGKPAVVMNRYGMAEVVQHGETGFTANTPEEAVRYLEKLLDDTALRTWMGKAARETVEEKFSEKRMVEELEKIYGHAGEVRSEGNTRVAADRQR
jgi:glycosyltransferase involved in cell wall biosynthesis